MKLRIPEMANKKAVSNEALSGCFGSGILSATSF
jgi:hypothetical protein